MVIIANSRRSMILKRSTLTRVGGLCVIHEQARQVEQTGKPGDDENDVESLEPEHERPLLSATVCIGLPKTASEDGFAVCRGGYASNAARLPFTGLVVHG